MNYAILGTSMLCKQYATAIERAGDCFYGVCSRELCRAEEFAGGRALAFDNLDALLADKAVDAVYICLPNSYHAEASQKCLEAGKHVLCEKPVTTTPDEYRTLCNIADAANRKYAEAVMSYFSPVMPKLRNALNTEKIVLVRLDYCQRSRKLDRVNAGEMFPTFDRTLCGGVLYDLGIYPIHFAVQLFGTPKEVIATARYLKEVDATAIVSLRYALFDVVITVSKAGQGACGSEIICDKATYTLRNVSAVPEAVRKTPQSESVIGYGVRPPTSAEQYGEFLLSVHQRVIETFSRWACGQDVEEYLQLRRNSDTAQEILATAHRQIGYWG
jgi:Predicted dehydrogenases and related proteins